MLYFYLQPSLRTWNPQNSYLYLHWVLDFKYISISFIQKQVIRLITFSNYDANIDI